MKINTRDMNFIKFNDEVMNFVNYNGIEVYSAGYWLTCTGTSSCTLYNSLGKNVRTYQVYGNCVQDGTPTPEEPIEIECVGDRTNNLFNNNIPYKDLDTLITSADDLKAGLEAGQMIFYGTFKGSVGEELTYNRKNIINVIIPIEVNKTYCVNDYVKQGIALLDENFVITQAETSTVITNTTDAKYMLIYVYNKVQSISQQSYTLDDVLNKLMINEGEVSLDYEPYGYKIPIKISGKNLFNQNNIAGDVSGVYRGWYVAEGNITLSIVEKDPTVDISNCYLGVTGTGVSAVQYCNWLVEKGVIKDTILKNPSSSARYISIFPNKDETVEKLFKRFDIQVEVGEGTKYEPYVEPIRTNIFLDEPLRMIIDAVAVDYIDFENKKIVRNLGKVTYNGTETWYAYSYGGENNGYRIPNSLFVDGEPVLCNMLSNTQSIVNTLAIRKAYNAIYAYGIYNYYNTVDEWKAFLTENNVEVIGKLNIPIEESLDLPTIPTIKGTTIISVETTTEPSNLKVVYKSSKKEE